MTIKKAVVGVLVVLMSAAAISWARPDQPFMEAGRSDLEKAKGELNAALHDKGGHRERAIKITDKAIKEVNAGIAFARKHDHAVATEPDALAGQPDQPHMEAALGLLRSARGNLEQAVEDKGGHRANAIALIDQAINEVKLGIEAGS